MKKSQSLRHHHATRPSLALSPDDLGVLREGNETNEDVLRKQLLERDRECDRLKTLVQQLQAQLAERPALDKVKEMQKEHRDLELLLQGTMRENERSMAEVERGKTREKMLERELTRLCGDNWQTVLELPPHNASPNSIASPRNVLPSGRFGSATSGDSEPENPADKAATLARIEQIKLMVMGMEQRLEIRKEKLSKNMAEALEKEHRYQDLAKSTH